MAEIRMNHPSHFLCRVKRKIKFELSLVFSSSMGTFMQNVFCIVEIHQECNNKKVLRILFPIFTDLQSAAAVNKIPNVAKIKVLTSERPSYLTICHKYWQYWVLRSDKNE